MKTTPPPPAPAELTASNILRHVLRTREPFPLPTDADLADVSNDLGSVWFEAEHWVSLSKSQLARWLEVQANQITRWCNAGLPELSDGRILITEADRWLSANRADWQAKRDERMGRQLRNGSLDECLKGLVDAL